MTAPSPAPWTAHGFAVYSGETLVAQVPVAEFSDDRYVREHALPEGEAKLNLRLIRMAPELADCIRHALAYWHGDIRNMNRVEPPYVTDARRLLAALAAEEDSDA